MMVRNYRTIRHPADESAGVATAPDLRRRAIPEWRWGCNRSNIFVPVLFSLAVLM